MCVRCCRYFLCFFVVRLIFVFARVHTAQTPVQQRHVQLLGRSVDLTRRVSVAMNLKISEVNTVINSCLAVPCGALPRLACKKLTGDS